MTFCPAVHFVVPPTEAQFLTITFLQATKDGKFGSGGSILHGMLGLEKQVSNG